MMDATSNHFDPESTTKKPMIQSVIVPGPVDVQMEDYGDDLAKDDIKKGRGKPKLTRNAKSN